MRKTPLLLAVAVVLAGLAGALVWMFRGPPVANPIGDPSASLDAPRTPAAAAAELAAPSTAPHGGPGALRAPVAAPAPDARPVAPGTAKGEGALRVVLAPVGGRAAPRAPRVRIEAVGTALRGAPLPAEQTDGAFVFASLPTGRYRVRVLTDEFRTATAEVSVLAGVQGEVTVPLAVGATASYRVEGGDGAPAPPSRLELLGPAGTPVAMTVDTVASSTVVEPGKTVLLPSEGRLVGLAPGAYVLRVLDAEGRPSGESAFVARDDAPATVTLRARR